MSQISYIKYANRTGSALAPSTAASRAASASGAPRATNVNGFFGGLGYAAEKLGLGFLSSIEGIVDYTAGGIAKLFKNDAFAETVLGSDWVNYNHADEWYNPGEGWRFVGDVAGGIGTSLPAIAASAVVSAATGGAATPAALGLVSSAVAGLGAAGGAAKEAYLESGKADGNAFAYGALSGATEAGLEYVSGIIGAGSGAIARRFGSSTRALARSTAREVSGGVARRSARTLVGQLAADFLGEGFEEGMSEILAPVYKRMTYDEQAPAATAREVGYSALVGAISGVIMGGAARGVNAAVNVASGSAAVRNGTASAILRTAKEISESPDCRDTGYGVLADIKEHYEQLSSELADGEEVSTVRQKRLLGLLKQENTVAVLLPFVERSAENIVRAPELYAERFEQYGLRDRNGAPLSFSSEELLAGLDMRDLESPAGRKRYLRSLRQSLTSDTPLARLAVAEATGSLMLDTRKLADSLARGERIASEADIEYFMNNASPRELEAVAGLFGVNDLGEMTRASLNEKISALGESGTLGRNAEQLRRMMRAESAETAVVMPQALSEKLDDGIYRVDNVSVIKEGSVFYVYDHAERSISRPLGIAEADRIIAQYRAERSSRAAEVSAKEKAPRAAEESGGEPSAALNKKNDDKLKISYSHQKASKYDDSRAEKQNAIVEEDNSSAKYAVLMTNDIEDSRNSRKNERVIRQEKTSNIENHKKRLPRINRTMSDNERYAALCNLSINVDASTNLERLSKALSAEKIDVADIESISHGEKVKLFRNIGAHLGVCKEYHNLDTGLKVRFSKGGIRESVSKQGSNYSDLAALFSCLDQVVENAVEIEVHNRNEQGYKQDITLRDVHVLVGAFENDGFIIPVKLEIKEFSNMPNTLYVAIALDKIKKNESVDTENGQQHASSFENNASKNKKMDEIVAQEVADHGVAQQYAPSSKKVDEIVAQEVADHGVAQQYAPSSINSISHLDKKVNRKNKKTLNNFISAENKDDISLKYSDEFDNIISNLEQRIEPKTNLKISLSEIFKSIDTSDKRLAKYIPTDFFNDAGGIISASSESFDSAENVPSGENKVKHKRSFKQVVSAASLAAQIELVNSQAGIEHAGKRLGVKNVEALVQAVRASKNQAQEMLAGKQWTIMGERVVKCGDGFYKIIEPVTARGKAYYRDFQSYLFHRHNVDRMSLTERSVAKNAAERARHAELVEKIDGIEKNIKELRATPEAGKSNSGAADRLKSLRAECKALRRAASALQKRLAAFAPEENKPVLSKLDANGAPVAIDAAESRATALKYEELHPEFRGYAASVYSYLDNLQKMRLDAGLITEELYIALKEKYPHYVPTLRTSAAPHVRGVRGGGDLAVSKTLSSAEGSLSPLLSLDRSVSAMTEQVISAANVNRLVAALYDSAAEQGNADFVAEISRRKLSSSELSAEVEEKVAKKNHVSFFRGGEVITLGVTPEVYAGFRAFNEGGGFSSLPVQMLSASTSLFKKLVTSYNPFFLITNAVRDIMDAGINTRYPKSFAKNYVRAVHHLAYNTETAQLYRAVGGFNSSVFNYENGIVAHQSKMGFAVPNGKLRAVFAKMENLNMFIEQMPRFAEFLSAIEAGSSPSAALLASAEVTTNFARNGKITRTLNKTVIPFLNPAVQGLSKIVRNTREAFSSVKAFASFSLKLALLGILPQFVNQLWYEDDEDYHELDDRIKENYYLFKAGDVFVRIPKGRVNSVVAGLVNRGSRAAKGETVDWSDYLGNVITQVTPVENFTRPIWAPIQDAVNNTTWYGSRIEGVRFDNVRPRDRYDEGTSAIAIAIGKFLNYSPKKLHYIFDQYSGIIGDIILPLTTARAEKDPFSARFITDPVSSNRLSDDFYKLYEEAQYSKAEGTVAAVYQLKYLGSVKSAASELYSRKSEIQASELGSVEKLQQTRAVQVLINELFRGAIANYSNINAAIEKTQGLYDEDQDSRRRYAEVVRLSLGAESAMKAYGGAAYESCALLNRAGISYELLYDFYFAAASLTSDVDEDGVTVSGSKRRKLIALVDSLNLSPEEKLLLIAMRGYKLRDGDVAGLSAEKARRRLNLYLISRPGLTKSDKALLRERAGLGAA